MSRADIFTPTYKKEERYSDFHLSFAKNPITGNLSKVTNEESIKQALRSLILTNKGERFYISNLGSKLRAALFEPADPVTAEVIRMTIQQTIAMYEPRVNVLSVNVYDRSEQNDYLVNIVFNLINIPDILQLDLFLKRVR